MSWIARLLALAIIAVLADAAVATVHGTTVALVAVGGGAALAVVALALLWPRPWIAFAFAFLMLTAAFAVGTLAGVPSGPAFSGSSPADAAALVFAFAMLVAGIGVCIVVSNVLLRVLVVALAAYALITTAASIQHGGLSTAFGTAPLAWTRGPYVAAEVLLPLAAAGALVYGVVAFAGKRGASGTTALVLAVALVAAIQLGALAAGAAGLPTLVAFEHPAITAPGGAESSSTGAQSSGGVSQANGAGAQSSNPARADAAFEAETGALFTPKGDSGESSEIRAAAAALSSDPQHALDAVAGLSDDLYPGALAGSIGALRSGSGNSVDKALLLRDLVRVATPGIETAFARCTLAAADAETLVAQVRAAHNPHPKIVLQSAGPFADTTTDPTLRTKLRSWSQAWTGLVGQTQSEGKSLGAALQTAGLALPPGQPAPERLRALAAQHVWLRAKVNGTWTDLDPTIQPAAFGKTRCASQSQSGALPDDLYDVLGVRVAVEQLGTGGPQRTVVFDRTVRTADIGDRDVSFMFAEPVGMDGVLASANAPVNGAMNFTPLLRVGDENLSGTAIVLPTPPRTNDAVSKGVGAAASALDAGTAAPSPTATAALPVVSGLWLELSVAAPGSDTTTVKSPIFDRVGYAARAAHATPPALSVAPDSRSYRAMQTVWNVAVSAGHAASAGGPATIPPGSDVPSLSRALAQLHGAYYALRRALIDDARGANVGVAASQPGISLLAMTNSGFEVDISRDDALPLAVDDDRLVWAAASVLAEREVINGRALLTTGDLGAAGANDALAAFDRATASGTHAVALHPADGTPPQSTAIPDEARARMTAHLARGDSLLAFAPTAAQSGGPPYAYWVVDPRSGTLRDENAFGRHPEGAEDTVVTEEVAIKNISTWRKFTCTILPVIRAAGFALSVAHGSLPFSPAGLTGLGAANRAATQAAVDGAQSGLDQPTCAGP